MDNHKNSLCFSVDEEQGKDNDFTGQFETIFKYLQNHIATASMVAEATGIPQKNICRYKRDLEKVGRLKQVYKSFCEKTGFKAWYLTTNPILFPDENQLFLFEE